MFQLSAKSRIAIGLVSLLVSALCTAMLIGIVPNTRPQALRARAAIAETLAMLTSDHISRGELRRLEGMLQAVVLRNQDLLSAGVRRSDGSLAIDVGGHANFPATAPILGEDGEPESTEELVLVPIRSGRERWGTVELRFQALRAPGLWGWLVSPWPRLTVFLGAACYVMFFLFLQKMLEHLDPSKTVPRRVRAALDSLAEGLLVIDRSDRIVLANQAFAAWVDRLPEKLIGQRASSLAWVRDNVVGPADDLPWVAAIEEEAAQAGRMLELAPPGQERRILMANASPVLGHDGKYRGVLVSFDDVTRLEETKKDLSEAKHAAEEANRAKSDFLARMSHEIRTPMNAILGYTDVMRRGFDERAEERQEYLDTIHASGEHLLALINDILDLSKIESGRLDLELTPSSPMQLVQQVVSVLKGKAEERGIALEVECPEPIPATIVTDAVRLRQAVMNLAGNAIKFTSEGGVYLRVLVNRAKEQLSIDVIDTGIGIPPDSLERIFQPFSQADNSITRRFGGTGLGLAISRQLAEAMGGGIDVRSIVGKGSVFTVTVNTGPLKGVPFLSKEQALAALREAAAAGGVRARPTARLPGGRVLVADDGESNRKLVRLVLERAGVQVTCVENGRQAVDAALGDTYHVILMDMQMPVMDGYTASTTLRQAGYTGPIVALTAHAMRGDEEKCRAAGCSGFLPKPINIDRLLAILAEALKDVPADELVLPPPALAEPAPSAASSPRDRQPARGVSGGNLAASSGPPLPCSLPLDDPDFREIAEEFSERLTQKLDLMERALATEDLEELAALAHWLKGAGGTAGFDDFTLPARTLELAAKQGEHAVLPEVVAELRGLADRIQLPALPA